MIRVALYLILVGAIAYGVALFADRAGLPARTGRRAGIVGARDEPSVIERHDVECLVAAAGLIRLKVKAEVPGHDACALGAGRTTFPAGRGASVRVIQLADHLVDDVHQLVAVLAVKGRPSRLQLRPRERHVVA